MEEPVVVVVAELDVLRLLPPPPMMLVKKGLEHGEGQPLPGDDSWQQGDPAGDEKTLPAEDESGDVGKRRGLCVDTGERCGGTGGGVTSWVACCCSCGWVVVPCSARSLLLLVLL